MTMNSSVDPCDDFYEYACGGWDNGIGRNFGTEKLSPKRYMVTWYNEILFNYNFHVNQEDYKHSRAFNQTKTFFNSCHKSGQDFKPVYSLLKNLDLPKIPYAITKLENGQSTIIEKTLAKCQLFLGTSLLFDVDTLPDSRNDTRNITRNIITLLGSSTKHLPPRQMVSDVIETIIYDVYHNETDENLLKNLQERIQDATSIIFNLNQELMDIEVKLKVLAPMALSIQDLSAHFQSIRSIMQPKYPFSWTLFMTELLEDFGQIRLEDEVAVSNAYVFHNIDALLTKTPPENLELFIWWKVIEILIPKVAPNLGNNTRRTYPDCCEEIFSNFDFVSLRLLSTSEQLHKKYAEIDQMTRVINTEFAKTMLRSDWLDAPYRFKILKALSSLKYSFGPPKWIFDDSKLDEYYAQISMSEDNFLENILHIKHQETLKKFQNHFLGHVEHEPRLQRRLNLRFVNAGYRDWYHQIEVGYTFLLYPFYNDLKFSNYGIFGFMLGHELLHAFDASRISRYSWDAFFGKNISLDGKNYFKLGEDSQKNFYEKTKCFIDQYKNYDLKEPGLSFNAELSLNEIIADNGGIRLAFEAYQEWKDANGEEKSLPLFSTFSSEQLFFLEFAQTFCETYTHESLVHQLKDVHPPNFVRINGALRNSESFSRVWNCPAGSKMNPENKCRIW